MILAGTGFRTDPRAHAEAARVLGREVVSLELVDPRYYHLDTALAVLDADDDRLAARGASAARSRARAAGALPGRGGRRPRPTPPSSGSTRSPTAATSSCPAAPPRLAAAAGRARLRPVPVDLSELLKGGGGRSAARWRCAHDRDDCRSARPTTAPPDGVGTRSSMERHSAHNYHPLPVVVADAEGAWVTDVDGRRYLDCLAGYSALNFGHRHPALVAAAHRAARPGHAHQPRLRQRPLGPFCARARRRCSARRWCCR